MQETEPAVSLKDRAKWAVDCIGRELVAWGSLGLLFFAATFSAYPLAALLGCGGLFIVLMLRRIFKLDRPLDDPARIAATQRPIMQDAEKEMSWQEHATAAVAYLYVETFVWAFFGFAYWLGLINVLLGLAVAVILLVQ